MVVHKPNHFVVYDVPVYGRRASPFVRELGALGESLCNRRLKRTPIDDVNVRVETVVLEPAEGLLPLVVAPIVPVTGALYLRHERRIAWVFRPTAASD